MQQLLEQQRDFDFVDENALSSTMILGNGTFKNLSGQHYSTVLIPSAISISKKALIRLQVFAASGGKVVFLGSEPSLIIDQSFRDASGFADLSWAIKEPSDELTPQVMDALPQPDVKLDKSCPTVKYIHRKLADADLYFFFNESTEQQMANATLAGIGQTQEWNAMTGDINIIENASSENGQVELSLELEPYGTTFIVVGKVPTGM